MTLRDNDTFPSEEDLRESLAVLSETARPRQDCPPAADIWRARSGNASVVEMRSIVLHTSGCPACMEAWRLAREVGSVQSESSRTTTTAVSWAPSRGMLLGVAAAASFMVVAGAMLLVLPRPEESAFRESAEQAIGTLVPDGATLPRAEFRLRWTSPESRARFHLRVMTDRLQQIASAPDLTAPEYLVLASAFKGIEPGTTILWRVDAYLPDGHVVGSQTFRVLVE